MRADQMHCCSYQGSIVPRRLAVRQKRDVFEAGANAMASLECTLVDCPASHAITVVDLVDRDARRHHNVFHFASVLESYTRIVVKGLDQDAATPACQAGNDESVRIFRAQQSSLDPDSSR
jgi:hypothetical protein